MGRRTRMCGVFRRDRDVSSKNPADGVDPRCAASWARRQGVLSLRQVSLHRQRKVARAPLGARKPLLLKLLLKGPKSKSERELSLPFGERVTFLCSCKEKLTKRKHALPAHPPRCALQVHCAAGIFRRDIPVSSKNDVLVRFAVESGAVAARRLPVRRGEAVLRIFPPNPCTSPLRGLVRQLRCYGREPGKSKSIGNGSNGSNGSNS